MAAPRCMRSFLGPAKRVRISPLTIPQARHRSNDAREDRDDRDDGPGDEKLMGDLMADIEAGNMSLDERLTDMGLDPVEAKKLLRSQAKVDASFSKREPKTREYAQRLWKRMQKTPDHLTLLHAYKRAGLEPIKLAAERGITLPTDAPPLDPAVQHQLNDLRTPINVRAIHLRPLRHTPPHGVPVCDLQLRTYSIRQLLLFADFAVRAAYYMGLPCRGPVPLPRITERWTVPRSNFIFKKSQESFERVTLRRLVQIQDGHVDTVKAWLAFLVRHQVHGVGMKANVWEFEGLESAVRAGYEVEKGDWSRRREGRVLGMVEEILGREGYREAMEGYRGAESVEWRP